MSTQYLTLDEVSRRLHMAPGTARNRMSRHDPMPPSVRIGRRRLFPEDQFNQWMHDRQQCEQGQQTNV